MTNAEKAIESATSPTGRTPKRRNVIAAGITLVVLSVGVGGYALGASQDHEASTASASPSTTSAAVDPAALLAAVPEDTKAYLGWALEKQQPYIFLAHNGAGHSCMTWVLQSNGDVVAFSGDGPYRGGLLANQRLADIPQARWPETLQCTMPDEWVNVPSIPASEVPRPTPQRAG